MEDVILLPARYGLTHKLKHLKDNLWEIEFDKNSTGTYGLIGFDGEHEIGQYVSALDPEGGPFMEVDSVISDKYIIKSITRDGIFHLVLKQ